MQPLINILIRTSQRPNLFKRALESVDRQTYTNLRVLVGYDTDYCEYMPSNVEGFHMENRFPEHPYFYNDYCNQLKSRVDDGFFMFLDDDDFLLHTRVLENIAPYLKDPDNPVICQFERRNKPKPMRTFMETGQIVSGHIGLPCLLLHAKWAELGQVGTTHDNDDYRYIKHVCEKLRPTFVQQVVVGTDRRSYGTRIDAYTRIY